MTATIANADDAEMRGNEKPGMEVDIKPRHSERETGGGGGISFASSNTTKAALPPVTTTNLTTINLKARLSSPEDNYDSENYDNSAGPQERAAASVLASVSAAAAANAHHPSSSSPVQHTPPSTASIAAETTPAGKATAEVEEGDGNNSGGIITPTRKRITRSHSGDMLTERVRVKADPLGQRPAEWALREEVEAVRGGRMVRAEN
ncbi:hypothetical protein EX30DRAFT_340376 [Ascodesmis nigricans]|uniref:Uncharacterized protein n=1 Tax=Ascodesmis nigricans TaxID=341454 RepID=A0A4S2MZG4_9PEZI|nr:hypothetical protein EX30DRAFT_340376 [Ascodesmis nigricans]